MAKNPDNEILFLSNTIDRGIEQRMTDDPDTPHDESKFVLIGMGKDFTPQWNPAESEEENTRRLDLETAKAYF